MSTSASLSAEVAVRTASSRAEKRSTVEEMFDRCCAGLYRYVALRTGRDRELADEIMQQLWLQACKSARRIPPDEFEYWLRRVAKNLIADHWRKKIRRAEVPIGNPKVARELAAKLDAERLPPDLIERQEILDQVALAVSALPNEEQDLIIRHYVEGCPFAEIAEHLGLSERAVEGRLYRARQKLKNMLAHLEEAS